MLGWTIHEKITLVKKKKSDYDPGHSALELHICEKNELSIGKWVAWMNTKYPEFILFFW